MHMLRRTSYSVLPVLVLAAGCTSPGTQIVRDLPEPLVQRPGQLLRPQSAPQPKPLAKAAPKKSDGKQSWFPPGGFSKRWKYIVVHHSADERSTPEGMAAWHRQRGWDELGYHFVIGNGVNTRDGAITPGTRWPKQKHGAHTRISSTDDNRWNEHGIGICLIGNFEKRGPTPKQIESLTELLAFLTKHCRLSESSIYTHGGVDPHTKCPGRNFSLHAIKQRLARARMAGEQIHASAR